MKLALPFLLGLSVVAPIAAEKDFSSRLLAELKRNLADANQDETMDLHGVPKIGTRSLDLASGRAKDIFQVQASQGETMDLHGVRKIGNRLLMTTSLVKERSSANEGETMELHGVSKIGNRLLMATSLVEELSSVSEGETMDLHGVSKIGNRFLSGESEPFASNSEIMKHPTAPHLEKNGKLRALQATNPCQSLLDATNACVSPLPGCGTCLNDAFDEVLAMDPLLCGGFESGLCSAIYTECVNLCGTCQDETEAYYECIAFDSGCSIFDCGSVTPTPPVPAPTRSPTVVEDPCQAALDATNACVSSLPGCGTCLNNAFDEVVAMDPLLCSDFESGLCSAINEDCAILCGTCQDETEAYYECIALDSGCTSFECGAGPVPAPTAAPTPAPTPAPTVVEDPCQAALDATNACVSSLPGCGTCLNNAFDEVVAMDPLLCSDFESGLCSAINEDCAILCGTCQDETEAYYECIALDSGCTSFECGAGPVPAPTAAPTPAPTPAPTVVEDPCQAALDATNACVSSLPGCGTCLINAFDEVVAMDPLLCSDFESGLCSAINEDCAILCGTCQDETEAYYECIALDSGCTSFECGAGPVPAPTAAPTPAPTPAPTVVEDPCQAALDATNACVGSFPGCGTCMNDAFDEVVAMDPLLCSDFEDGLCTAINAECANLCGDCGDEIEAYYECISLDSGCTSFQCVMQETKSPIAPTPVPTAAPTQSPNIPPAPTPTAVPTVPAVTTRSGSSSDSSNLGAIIGGAVGGVAIIAISVVVIVWMSSRNRGNTKPSAQPEVASYGEYSANTGHSSTPKRHAGPPQYADHQAGAMHPPVAHRQQDPPYQAYDF